MHELSITQGVVKIVTEQAVKHGESEAALSIFPFDLLNLPGFYRESGML